MPPVEPQKGMAAEGEDAAVGCGQVVAGAGRRRYRQAGTEPRRVVPPASPVSWGSWWNIGHAEPATRRGAVRAGDLEVVDLSDTAGESWSRCSRPG